MKLDRSKFELISRLLAEGKTYREIQRLARASPSQIAEVAEVRGTMIDLDDLKGQLQARGVELQGQIAKQESELQAQLKGKRDEVQLYQNLQPHVRELKTQKLDLELAILGLKFEMSDLKKKCAKLRDSTSVGLNVLDLIRQYCRDEHGILCSKCRKLLYLLLADDRYRQLVALRKSYEVSET